jgi:site-specific DNA recombinase
VGKNCQEFAALIQWPDVAIAAAVRSPSLWLQCCGVERIFLNRSLGRSPEDDLLLQVQGMVAEYERAKILERSRRGKRHAAQQGSVNVLSGAPYGYRYISKCAGGESARYEIVLEEARVVRQIFTWAG